MFINMQNQLDNPTVCRLVSESASDKSAEAMDRKITEFRCREARDLYGWVENNEILGVCGVEIHTDWVEIYNIAVEPNARKCGIGKAMIAAVQQKYKVAVKAETDDDAVAFYRKCGFETEGFMKTYPNGEIRRYKCVLQFS